MHYHPNKNDLRKLKDSKPVPITAHTHEVIVPVVYSGLVNTFLKKKGIELPLTHHQLAKFKEEAGVAHYNEHDHGFAKGIKGLKKKKKKTKKEKEEENKKKKKQINITIHNSSSSNSGGGYWGGGGGGGGGFRPRHRQPPPALPPPPSTFSTIQPRIPPHDTLKLDSKPMDYSKIVEEYIKQTTTKPLVNTTTTPHSRPLESVLANTSSSISEGLRLRPSEAPLRTNDFDILDSVVNEESHREHYPTNTGASSSSSSSYTMPNEFDEDVLNTVNERQEQQEEKNLFTPGSSINLYQRNPGESDEEFHVRRQKLYLKHREQKKKIDEKIEREQREQRDRDEKQHDKKYDEPDKPPKKEQEEPKKVVQFYRRKGEHMNTYLKKLERARLDNPTITFTERSDSSDVIDKNRHRPYDKI